MGVAVGFSLQQFSGVFNVRDAKGQPYVLIGGQAVNYWAERYLPQEPQLETLKPFTSEDIDFKGDHADVERIATQLRLTPSYPHKAQLTALAGVIPFRIGDLHSAIEVVQQLPGLSAAQAPAIETEWNGKHIRVLDPISLLACKLELVATVPQDKRRDIDHVKILLPCVRAFLAELLQQVERGQLPARAWLKVAQQVLKVTGTPRAQKLARKHQLNWSEILPLATLAKSTNEKLLRFLQRQQEVPKK